MADDLCQCGRKTYLDVSDDSREDFGEKPVPHCPTCEMPAKACNCSDFEPKEEERRRRSVKNINDEDQSFSDDVGTVDDHVMAINDTLKSVPKAMRKAVLSIVAKSVLKAASPQLTAYLKRKLVSAKAALSNFEMCAERNSQEHDNPDARVIADAAEKVVPVAQLLVHLCESGDTSLIREVEDKLMPIRMLSHEKPALQQRQFKRILDDLVKTMNDIDGEIRDDKKRSAAGSGATTTGRKPGPMHARLDEAGGRPKIYAMEGDTVIAVGNYDEGSGKVTDITFRNPKDYDNKLVFNAAIQAIKDYFKSGRR